MTKLKDFAVADGWTQDEFDTANDRMALHKSTVYVQFHWDNTDDIGVWQSLNFTGGQLPGNHPNDSGNIASPTGAVTNGRRWHVVSNGPFTSHHFFSNADSIYVALQTSAGQWRFLGFGKISKLGNWTGGEFLFATMAPAGGGAFVMSNASHTHGFDARCNTPDIAACMHVEGLPGQGGTGKWGVFADTLAPGNDDAAVARVGLIGGIRDGIIANGLGYFQVSYVQGFVPLLPIPAFYLRRDTTPDHFHPLGFLLDFRQLNIGRFVAEQEVLLGGDTWVIFPALAKINDGTSTPQTGNGGFAIRKIV